MRFKQMMHVIIDQISECFRKCNHDYYETLEESKFDISRLAREIDSPKEKAQPIWMS